MDNNTTNKTENSSKSQEVICLIDTYLGDSGKGKIISYFTGDFNDKDRCAVCVRSNGSSNAGHTLKINGKKIALHLIPSSSVYPDIKSVIAHGCLVNPIKFMEEIKELNDNDFSTDNIHLSDNAHVIMPYHVHMDGFEEEARAEEDKIGTTRQGVGPCAADRTARVGIRVRDLYDLDVLEKKIRIALTTRFLMDDSFKQFDVKELAREYHEEWAEKLRPYVADTLKIQWEAMENGENIIYEGAQGWFLDPFSPGYPKVTSTPISVAGQADGAGIPANSFTRVHAVVKAFASRIAEGPFPSRFDLSTEEGKHLDEVLFASGESGATTGRRRILGSLDTFAQRFAFKINGVTELSLTKLDALRGLPLQLCVGYELDGEELKYYPFDENELARVKPIIETYPAFEEDIAGMTNYDDLPQEAKNFVEAIEKHLKVPVSLIGTGPGNDEVIVRY